MLENAQAYFYIIYRDDFVAKRTSMFKKDNAEKCI